MNIFNIAGIKKEYQLLMDTNKQLLTDKEKCETELKVLENKKLEMQTELQELKTKIETLDIQLKSREQFFVVTELKHIDSLEGIEFEKYCESMLRKIGFDAEVTQASNDDGGDIIAKKDNERYIFQCKNYSNTVGNKAIQEVYAARGIYKANKAIVITNNYFTKQAKKEAEQLDVILWDRNEIEKILYMTYDFDLSQLNTASKKEKSNIVEIKMEEIDPLLNQAILLVVESKQVSTSLLQRNLKIGYARSARIIDQMEAKGIVSAFDGENLRQVLISKDEWNKLQKS